MPVNLSFPIGSIVTARSREWIVQPGSTSDLLHLRPLAGSDKDDCSLVPDLEPVPPSSSAFGLPDFTRPGDAAQAALLRDALQMKLRNGAGPFRSFANLAVEPRAYQFVPLLMALRLPVVRLLVADDVGLGKTVEAGLVLREFLDRGEIDRAAVLCPPHLVDQWVSELDARFHISATALTSRSAEALERNLAIGETVFSRHPFLVISLDYIKTERHRGAFIAGAPSFLIVDEAHACTTAGTGRQYRWQLLNRLASDPARHLLLLTGTPHSGDTDAFYNLLSLLKPEFAELSGARANDKSLREDLSRHFVQRRRIDIQSEWNGAGIFPRRDTAEVSYTLPDDWRAYLADIYEFCRGLANEDAATQARRDFNGFTALALLRCASSSPAAAVTAFDSRLASLRSDGAHSDADAPAAELDAGDSIDDIPGLYDDGDDSAPSDAEADLARLRKTQGLRALRDRAARFLAAPDTDPKLNALVNLLRTQLLRGAKAFHPIVFCRYVKTAQYVAEGLRAAFPRCEVRAVTGEDAADERAALVANLSSAPSRILVATDCLSEGINLQDAFDAVIHYDMVWNPTRHEQREGRVDRFGQRRDSVRCVLLYGQDNPVDGLVLANIVRKADTIRKELGIAVPVPVDDRRVKSAILESFRLRRVDNPRQLTFDDILDHGSPDSDVPTIDVAWQNAVEREKRNLTVFAQRAIHPEAVQAELAKSQALLGSPADVERFVRTALAFLGAPLGEPDNGVASFDPARLPSALRDLLAEAGIPVSSTLLLAFDPAAADRKPGVRFVRRTDPLVAVLADFVVESALSGSAPPGIRPASRCAATRTRVVSRRNVLLVQRLRHLLKVSGTTSASTLVGEEIALFLSEGAGPFQPLPVDSPTARALFTATPSANLDPDAIQRALQLALGDLQAQSDSLDKAARARADVLLADHRSVRATANLPGRSAVEAVIPADTLGIYVFLPAL